MQYICDILAGPVNRLRPPRGVWSALPGGGREGGLTRAARPEARPWTRPSAPRRVNPREFPLNRVSHTYREEGEEGEELVSAEVQVPEREEKKEHGPGWSRWRSSTVRPPTARGGSGALRGGGGA